ncbi:MAG: hypothetical protein K1060chlam2_00661 [Chlamydiae bacterium]|nr:hypothetical protein [Chlamydiota bacterium]
MRSRYVAYTQNNFDYIAETMTGPFNRKESEASAKEIEWLKLEVLSSEERGDEGTVHFIAFFKHQGRDETLHELSHFKKLNGKWSYIQGEVR